MTEVGAIEEREHPVRILHLHSSFSLGGKEARSVRLMNLMGDRAQHTILSAVPEALGARDAIDPEIDVSFPTDAPPLAGGRRWRVSAILRPISTASTWRSAIIGARWTG